MAPKDEKIVNKDDSVTNAEANSELEKGAQDNEQEKLDEVRVPTVTPDNENGDPGPPEEEPAVDKGETKDDSEEL